MVAFSLHRPSRWRASLWTGLLAIACLAGCAHWPTVETSTPHEFADSPLALDAPEPAIGSEATIQETAQPEEVAIFDDAAETVLGSPAPFPRPGSGIASTAPSTATHREQLPIVSEAAQSRPGWREVGSSHEGREIEAIQFGTIDNENGAQQRVLFISSMSGSDPESVRFIDRLSTRLSRTEMPADLAILLIRSPNPDGLAAHISTNSRGVELNRNFPSPRFPVTRTTRTGPEPASELETQAVIALLADFQPTRIVHVRPGSGERLLLLCDDELHRPVAASVSSLSITAARHDGDFKAGSLEEFCRNQFDSAIITAYLPGSQSTTDADDLLHGVALSCAEIELPALADESASSLAHSASSSELIEPHGERGFVEDLPPPDDLADRPQDSRYYELPPPPE